MIGNLKYLLTAKGQNHLDKLHNEMDQLLNHLNYTTQDLVVNLSLR